MPRHGLINVTSSEAAPAVTYPGATTNPHRLYLNHITRAPARPGPRLAPSPAGPSLTVRAQAVSLGPAYVPVPSPSLRVWQRQCMAQRRMRQRRRRSAPGRLPSQVRLAEITAKCTPSQASRPVPVTVRSGSAQSRCKLREAGLGPCVRSDCPARARARQRPASLSCGRITLFLVSGDG